MRNRKLRFEALSRLSFESLERRIVMAAAVDPSVISVNEVVETAPRDAAYWPFASDSPWNTSVGTGTQYATIDSPVYSSSGGASLNVTNWSIPVYVASSTDPFHKFYDDDTGSTVVASIRVPANAAPDPQSDGTLVVIDGTTAVEMWRAHKLANGDWSASQTAVTDLTGQGFYPTYHGVRAGGMSVVGGLIRKDEVANLWIPHALAVAVDPKALNRYAPGGKAFVWPASWADGTTTPGGNYGTTGNLYMGSLLAIPPSVDIYSLGLTAQGLAVARAMQNYGAYISETGGANIAYYAEPAAASAIERGLSSQLAKLTPYLQVVTNNSSTNVGGGGERRSDSAPQFIGEPAPTPDPIPGPTPAPTTDPSDPTPVQAFSISGVVRDSRGHVLANVDVQLISGTTYLRTVRTDSEGRYRFSDVQPGTYRVAAGGQGTSYVWSERTLALEDDTGLDLSLAPKSHGRGRGKH